MGRMEHAVVASHLKAHDVLEAAHGAILVLQVDVHLAVLHRHVLERRALIPHLLKAVVAVQGRVCQSLAHLPLLCRVNLRRLVGIDKVVGAHQRAVGDDLLRTILLFTQAGSIVSVHVVVVERRNLHEVEGNLAQAELTAPLLHQQLQALGILVAGVAHVGTALIEEDALHRVVQNRVERTVAPQQRPLVVILRLEVHDAHRVRRLLGMFLQVLLRQPALHARAALVGLDDAHGHVERLAQQTGEEIARSRKLAHRQRRAHLPLALRVVLRLHAHRAGNLQRAHARMVHGVEDHLVVVFHRTVAEALHGHLHVRLTCAHPHLAHEHIADADRLAVVEGNRLRLEARFRRLHLHQPPSVLVRGGRCLLRAPRGSHRHLLLRFVPSPEPHLRLLLHHHVVANHVRQAHLRLSRHGQSGECHHEYQSSHHCHCNSF